MSNGNLDAEASRRIWFVTGASQGLGRELVRQVLERGDSVAATSRDPNRLASQFPHQVDGRFLPLGMSLNDPSQVAAAVGMAVARFGRIDVLVNNAGHGLLGAVEEVDDPSVHDMFEVNVHGLLRVTRQVLTHMRGRRSGHVVNLSSMSGLAGVAGYGLYCASKFAVEGLSEALAQEVVPLGIRVTIVEPGPFRTEFLSGSLRLSDRVIEGYAETAGRARSDLPGRIGRQPGDPVRGARAIITAVTSDDPPLHLVLGKVAIDRVHAKLQALRADLDRWMSVSLSTDFEV